jgi:hypothetical protein
MRHLTDPKQLRGLYGFLHNEVDGAAPRPYVSNDWTLLKDKCLELGAHRINGEEGTGRDLKLVIQRIDSHELARTVAALNPIDLRTHTELGYDEGIEIGERFAQLVIWENRNESFSLNQFLAVTLTAARNAGYTAEYGYSDDFVDGVHRGACNVTATSGTRLQALDDALEAESAKHPGVPAAVLLAGNEEQIRSHEVSYQHRQGKGLEPLEIVDSPIQQLLDAAYRLTAELAEDFPATGAEAASVAKQLAEEGDVDGLREFTNLLQAEHDNPSDRSKIAAVDEFILNVPQEEEVQGAELWIGGTDQVIGEPPRSHHAAQAPDDLRTVAKLLNRIADTLEA